MNWNTCQLWKNQYLVKSSNICTINNIHSATFRGAGSEATRKYGPKLLSQKRVSPDAFSSSFGLLATQNKLNGLLPINSLKKKSKQKKSPQLFLLTLQKKPCQLLDPFPNRTDRMVPMLKRKQRNKDKKVSPTWPHTRRPATRFSISGHRHTLPSSHQVCTFPPPNH